MDSDRFEAQMRRLLRSHYRENMPADDVILEIMAVYWDGLSDLSDAELAAAVSASLRAQAFFPKIAELRTYARPPKPARNPETDFDLIAGQRANQTVPLPQLPPGMTQTQADQRAADWETLVTQTLATIRANRDRQRQATPTIPVRPERVNRRSPLVANPAADADLAHMPGVSDQEAAVDLARWRQSMGQRRPAAVRRQEAASE